jgi:Fe-S cluster assembly protein SufD
MEQHELYVSSFRALEREFSARDPQWLLRLRREAIESFARLGFPTVHDEEWRFTNVAPLAKVMFQAAPDETDTWDAKDLESALPGSDPAGIRLVFVNGFYSERLSAAKGLPRGVEAGNLARLLKEKDGAAEAHLARYADHRVHPFVAMNTALWRDGAYVRFPKGTVLDRPVHVVHVATAGEVPLVSFPRNLIVAERETQLTVVESYLGLGRGVCFSNAVTEIVAGENAVLDHYKLQRANDQSFHIGALRVYADRNAHAASCAISLGGGLVRNDAAAVLDAEGADCTLNGLYLARGRQHVDNHTTLDHAKPHGSSRELYHGILSDHATAVFNGRIIVRPGAMKTDALQRNRNLLLSPDAVVDTKPQLEIYNNDVRCTHGATIGQLDAEALFYLRSRGIGAEEARAILIYAFAADLVERVKPAGVRAWVEDAVRASQKGAQ